MVFALVAVPEAGDCFGCVGLLVLEIKEEEVKV
jgi:hypothetical protein